MRHSVKLNLQLIEDWLSNLKVENEKQQKRVCVLMSHISELRSKEEYNIVLDVEDNMVLYRYKDGKEQIATSAEIDLYYAQCVAKGELPLEVF